ncbi:MULTISPECIES: hypothetical protein [unclassified Rathayibacter]|uniref:hypothetical protein n=1 Tax=unclassified Rathayibacter TaxID=2609250 RepID=UPI000CE8E964|nr:MULTISPECIES: hypothetical protein [unclassified Rathayibacter]PPH74574.1 hypothetical protein C5C90_10810 [Rathayibacter sp. AY1D4]PPH85518.1 hypothetical protein C5C64_16125 [Rathayibacter sp. AY1D3]
MGHKRSTYGFKIGAAAVALMAIPLLGGCAQDTTVYDDPTVYSDYDRAQQEQDALPSLGSVGDKLDPDSIRFAGSVEGLDFYLALPREGAGHCVIVNEGDEPVSGCGEKLSKQNDWTVQIHPDDAVPDDATGDGWTQLGKNLSVRAS